MGVDWDSWGELGRAGQIGTPFQVSGEIFCLSCGLSPFPLPVPIHPVCPNSPRFTVIHIIIPTTGVDQDRGGESGRRARARRHCLCVSASSTPLFRFTSSVPIRPGSQYIVQFIQFYYGGIRINQYQVEQRKVMYVDTWPFWRLERKKESQDG